MLATQEYLNEYSEKFEDPVACLAMLKAVFGIKYTLNEEYPDLVVLNYCQIDSPKLSLVTAECRSLVLEIGTWNVVSRSFDRFFNVGETGCAEIDWSTASAHAKVDGSLIGIFNYEGQWLWRTRSMIMPSDGSPINGVAGAKTWMEAVEEALGPREVWEKALGGLEGYTFIGEMTCRDNRIVTKYVPSPVFWLHAVRDNQLSGFISMNVVENVTLPFIPSWQKRRVFSFETTQACQEAAKELRNLEEGYVIYNSGGEPIGKAKNPAYVAAHHLRGEGVLTERRVLDLLIMEETDEYLSIFPEDAEKFDPYILACGKMSTALAEGVTWAQANPDISQKEFALIVKDTPIAALMFQVRKGRALQESFKALTRTAKYRMILAYKE